MRLSRLLLLPVVALSAAACSDDDGVTVVARPPLGGVRFINAVPDMRPFDIRMIDQTQWSANSTNGGNYGLAFRAGTLHWPTEAKARHIRVFPADSNIANGSRILLDTTITITANQNVTLLLVPGNRTSGTDSVEFITIVDNPPATTGQQVAFRLVNASTGVPAQARVPGTVDGWVLDTLPTTTISTGNRAWTGIAPLTVGEYVVRDTGAFVGRFTATGTTTDARSANAPAGAPENNGIGALAGARAAGSALSAYVFPRACPALGTEAVTVANCPAAAGSSAATRTAYANAAIVWFIDRIPTPPTLPTQP